MKNLTLFLLIVLLLTSCAPEHVDTSACNLATNDGFWIGIWHGWISPVTFIISLFSDSVEMYSLTNNGGWYNFGFLIGIGGISGSSYKVSKR